MWVQVDLVPLFDHHSQEAGCGVTLGDKAFPGAHLGKTCQWIVPNFPMYTSPPRLFIIFHGN